MSKMEKEKEFKNIIKINLENLKKIFSNNNFEQGETPVYIEIPNNVEEKLENFKKEIQEKIDRIYSETVDKDISEVFEKCLKIILNHFDNLRNEVEKNLKGSNWEKINNNFSDKLQKEINTQKNIIVTKLESLSDNLKKYYEESYKIINNFKHITENNVKIYDLKHFISIRFGEKYNYKEAIYYIVNDILSESKTATSWKNTESFSEYIKCLFSDKAYLIKTIDFIIKKANERLNNFSRNISYLIQQYLEMMSNDIDIEKNSLINNLEEQNKKNKELVEEKKNKWNILSQEFAELEGKIKLVLGLL